MKNLQWVKENNRHLLKIDGTTLIEASVNLMNGSTFLIGNKRYTLIRRGFWKQVYIVQHNEEEILNITHSFWGSNGRIVFNDGTVYTSDYKSKHGLTMRFMEGEQEILSYGSKFENKKFEPTFSIGTSMVDAEKLLILIACGKLLFTCLFGENGDGGDMDGSIITLIA